jgi:tellurium resistance protein TerZ
MTRTNLFAQMRKAPLTGQSSCPVPDNSAASVAQRSIPQPEADAPIKMETPGVGQVPLQGEGTVVVGLAWDVEDQKSGAPPVDLDASIVCFDGSGKFIQSISYAEPSNTNHSIFHKGDSRDGAGEGDDEQVVLDLKAIPPNVYAMFLVVNSYSGHSLASLKNAYVHMMRVQNDQANPGKMKSEDIFLSLLPSLGSAAVQAIAVGRLVRGAPGGPEWIFDNINIPMANCRSFADTIPIIQEVGLRPLIPHIQVQPPPTVLNLVKGEVVPLKSTAGHPLQEVAIGLGWKPTQGYSQIDLDASCMMIDANGNQVDVAFYGSPAQNVVLAGGRVANMKSSKCQSVIHSGDNRTGEGNGDDETIIVRFLKIPAHVAHLYFAITCYTQQPLSNLKSAYVRVIDRELLQTGVLETEVIRFDLSNSIKPFDPSTAFLVAKFSRIDSNNNWAMSSMGIPCMAHSCGQLQNLVKKDVTGIH